MADIKYEKLDYNTYLNRLEDVLKDPSLFDMGLKKHVLGLTKYGYQVIDYQLGNGKYDLFIVGGTHGSEIISVDFVTQLIKNAPFLTNYDPNLITLHMIPNLNPEGFDMTTQTMKDINNDNLTKESYDYYLRYRLDNTVNKYINYLNSIFKLRINHTMTPYEFIQIIKNSFNDVLWKNICDDKAIPKMIEFEKMITTMKVDNDFSKLFENINFIIYKIIQENKDNIYLISILNRLKDVIFSDDVLKFLIHNTFKLNKSNGSRLYQEKFENINIDGTYNPKLAIDINNLYKDKKIVPGSQIKFDATGAYINLNMQNPDNPGITAMKDKITSYGVTPVNNVKIFEDGPLGKPTEDPNNFTFSKENSYLNNLLKVSSDNNRLLGALLYHGTGGVVFSKPYQTEENKKYTDQILSYNDLLFDAYNKATGYTQVEFATNTGYGDLIRKTYPGVLLIELSEMGGNPLGPYGDQYNYNKVITDNILAVDELLATYNNMILSNSHLLKK